MICISNCCEKYDECGRTIPHKEIEQAVNWYSFGSATINFNTKDVKEDWWCGKLGNYAMFEPKTIDKTELLS